MAYLYPSINGVRASWAEIEFRLRGLIALGVKSINYKSSLEPTDVYGAGALPLGRTRGIAKFEGSVELLKEECDVLILTLGPGFGEVPFDIMVSYRIDDGTPASIRGAVNQDYIFGARIKSLDENHSQGADGLVVKADLSIMGISHNGMWITSKFPPIGAAF